MTEFTLEQHWIRTAFFDALTTNKNQIFLSASLDDSDRLQHYFKEISKLSGIPLLSNPFELPNGAKLFFLSLNNRASMGLSGNAYALNCFDESNFSDVYQLMSSWTVLSEHKAIFASEL